MTFDEAVKAMKAGHAVRREAWNVDAYFEFRPTGHLVNLSGMLAAVQLADLEATDWRRLDGLDADGADEIYRVAADLWTLSFTIQDALDHPGQQFGCRTRLHDDFVREIVEGCKGLTVANLMRDVGGVTQVDLVWDGDPPRLQSNNTGGQAASGTRSTVARTEGTK